MTGRLTGLAGALSLAVLSAGPAAASTTFVPGTGTSSAGVARVELRSSGAAIGVGLGVVRSRFAGAQGNAEAAGVDLGLFDTVSKSPLACGYSPGALFPPGAMPSRVTVSSGEGATQKRTASAGAGSPVQLGSQYGAAAPDASAAAGVDGMSLDLPGVLRLVGATASATAKLVPGSLRQSAADSSVTGLSLAGGLVELTGLRWTADHRSGAQSAADAGFSVASMTVGGRSLPTTDPGQLQAAITAANGALAPSGLSLGLPQVTRGADGVAITPLRLSVAATPALRAALTATLIAIQPIRTQLLTFVTPLQMSPDCGMAKALGFGYLLVDLATLVLGDQGSVDLDLGGARAGTDGTAYANPFDSGYGRILPAVLPPAVLPSTEPNGPAPIAPAVGRGPAPSSPGAEPAAAPPAPGTTVALAPVAVSCRSTHGGGCTAGHSGLAAGLALCLIVVLAAADRLRSRIN